MKLRVPNRPDLPPTDGKIEPVLRAGQDQPETRTGASAAAAKSESAEEKSAVSAAERLDPAHPEADSRGTTRGNRPDAQPQGAGIVGWTASFLLPGVGAAGRYLPSGHRNRQNAPSHHRDGSDPRLRRGRTAPCRCNGHSCSGRARARRRLRPRRRRRRTGAPRFVDRNGVLLATNLSTVSLVADPKFVQNPRETAYRLASVLPDLDPQRTEERLRRNSRFVALKRTLTPQQQFQINKLGLPGIDFDRKQTRVYPHGRLFSHVIGHTDVDNNGIAGLELRFDQDLRDGADPLRLSLDVRVQHLLREELTTAIDRFSAVGGAGIVTDVTNGEVVAMVSLPDFDPNSPRRAER